MANINHKCMDLEGDKCENRKREEKNDFKKSTFDSKITQDSKKTNLDSAKTYIDSNVSLLNSEILNIKSKKNVTTSEFRSMSYKNLNDNECNLDYMDIKLNYIKKDKINITKKSDKNVDIKNTINNYNDKENRCKDQIDNSDNNYKNRNDSIDKYYNKNQNDYGKNATNLSIKLSSDKKITTINIQPNDIKKEDTHKLSEIDQKNLDAIKLDITKFTNPVYTPYEAPKKQPKISETPKHIFFYDNSKKNNIDYNFFKDNVCSCNENYISNKNSENDIGSYNSQKCANDNSQNNAGNGNSKNSSNSIFCSKNQSNFLCSKNYLSSSYFIHDFYITYNLNFNDSIFHPHNNLPIQYLQIASPMKQSNVKIKSKSTRIHKIEEEDRKYANEQDEKDKNGSKKCNNEDESKLDNKGNKNYENVEKIQNVGEKLINIEEKVINAKKIFNVGKIQKKEIVEKLSKKEAKEKEETYEKKDIFKNVSKSNVYDLEICTNKIEDTSISEIPKSNIDDDTKYIRYPYTCYSPLLESKFTDYNQDYTQLSNNLENYNKYSHFLKNPISTLSDILYRSYSAPPRSLIERIDSEHPSCESIVYNGSSRTTTPIGFHPFLNEIKTSDSKNDFEIEIDNYLKMNDSKTDIGGNIKKNIVKNKKISDCNSMRQIDVEGNYSPIFEKKDVIMGDNKTINNAVYLSMDQEGSRFLQKRLENSTKKEIQWFFYAIRTHLKTLCLDLFGNYVIQKLIEIKLINDEIAYSLVPFVKDLSLHMYGCRVIQKILDHENKDIMEIIKNNAILLIQDQNGNHVIQKCVEKVVDLKFLIEIYNVHTIKLCKHRYGCRVVQRLFEHSEDSQLREIVVNLSKEIEMMMEDQYGNYVLQHIIENKANLRNKLIWSILCIGRKQNNQIVNDNYSKNTLDGLIDGLELLGIESYDTASLLKYCSHKFASNVIEKCVIFSPLFVDIFLTKVDKKPMIVRMAGDKFGNYVVQRVLENKMVRNCLRQWCGELKKSIYAKHILSKIQ